jgi:hypothetical protein
MKNTQVDNFSKSDPSGSNPKWSAFIAFYDFLTLSKAGTLKRHNTENSKQIFQELRGHSPNFHNHVSVSDLYIPTIGLPILLQENKWTDGDPGNI